MINLIDAITHCKEKAVELRKEVESKDLKYGKSNNPIDLKVAADCLECAEEHEQLAGWLEELVERREADRWILVSERLPEESDFYLVTMVDEYHTYVLTLFFMKGMPDMWEHDKRVTAWKPLPKPYESEA